MSTWQQRLRKWEWAQRNPEKVKAATEAWRAANSDKVRRQATERMRRYRARRRRQSGLAG